MKAVEIIFDFLIRRNAGDRFYEISRKSKCIQYGTWLAMCFLFSLNVAKASLEFDLLTPPSNFESTHGELINSIEIEFIAGGFDTSYLLNVVKSYDTLGWIHFYQDSVLEGTIMNYINVSLSLGNTGGFFSPFSNFEHIDTWDDDEGEYTHRLYQQLHYGYPVQGMYVTEHAKDGYALSLSGMISSDMPELEDVGIIPEATALYLLLLRDELDTLEFAWNDSLWEAGIRMDKADSNATYFPTGRLIWYYYLRPNTPHLNADVDGNRFRLAWEFEIITTGREIERTYYMDALNGTCLGFEELKLSDGPVIIRWPYSNETIDTKWKGGLANHHYLKAENNRNIHTKWYGSSNWAIRGNITDDDDIWGAADQMGTTPHWFVTNTWDYFRLVHGRNGFDNQGTEIRVEANMAGIQNAFSLRSNGSEYLQFGSNGSTYICTQDIAAHEFAHTFVRHATGLKGYSHEHGALHESYADIFGVLVEAWIDGSYNWTIGEDEWQVRNLANPLSDNSPNTYQGTYWSSDPTSVHTNCAVHNYWFYLLSMGGTLNGVTVSGISPDKAGNIVYYLLASRYLSPLSGYHQAMSASIEAAIVLYGECSNEHIQTVKAWQAVGLNPQLNCGPSSVKMKENPVNFDLQIYPNPGSSIVKIEVNQVREYRLEMYSVLGIKILDFTFYGTMTEMDIENLASGTYILRLTDVKNGTSLNRKFVRQ